MDVELPKLADTLVEGTVTRWLKRQGEHVTRGEPLVEIETDKVNSELEAPIDGILTEILAAEGQTVPVGQVIARIGTEGGADSGGAQFKEPAPPGQAPPSSAQSGLSPMRRRIAERMQEARATIPQGSCVREVDLSSANRGDRSWTAYFVKAVSEAAQIDNVGVAVDVPDGLVVPVVMDVPGRSLDSISDTIGDLAGRARAGRLKPDEVAGAGFTVTNVGSVGTLMAFPLLNPGQPGILAPGAIRDGRCYLTLCYDRRQYDEYAADRLLAGIAVALEQLH